MFKHYHLALGLMVFALCNVTFVYGQAASTRKTVHEKVTTIHETVTTVTEKVETQKKNRLVAIFVKNRAGHRFKEKLGAFEDLVVSAVTDLGFEVVSPEDTIKAMHTFKGNGTSKTVSGADVDTLLENNTSALRLAQNMGVDYILAVSITTYGQNTQHFKRPDLGIDRTKTTYKLRGSYKILDAGQGKSLTASTVLVTKTVQASNTMSETDSGILDDLMAEAAEQFASKLEARRTATILAKSTADKSHQLGFGISCSIQDMTVPEVIKDKKGKYTLTGNRYKLEPLSVTVELDGIVVGTAPGEFFTLPGLHKIKLTREGFQDWSRMINIMRDKQIFQVALQLTPQGRQQWMAMATFLTNMKQSQKLNDANVEEIKGYAQMLRQSGYRVDAKSDTKIRAKSDSKARTKSDIKIDTKEAPTINQKNIDVVTPTLWVR